MTDQSSIKMLLKVSLYFSAVFPFISWGKYTLSNIKAPADLDSVTVFTDDSIAAFDGSDKSKPVYMGVRGVVFDVTAGKGFYHKGDSYNVLVGKDSTQAVAKMSLEEEDLNSDISTLSEGELKSLDEIYSGVYLAKYPVVGYMDYLVNEWKSEKVEL